MNNIYIRLLLVFIGGIGIYTGTLIFEIGVTTDTSLILTFLGMILLNQLMEVQDV